MHSIEVTIRISKDDLRTLLEHLNRAQVGEPLVAVRSLEAVDGEPDFSITEELSNLRHEDEAAQAIEALRPTSLPWQEER